MHIITWRTIIWQQFGAAIDMFANALHACPDELWRARLFGWGEVSFAELQLYNMRHVREYGAQLSLFLGQKAGVDSDWVTTAERSAA
jgi:hypothetical protein